MRKLLKKQAFAPDVLVTDKLRSYGAAKSEIGLSARHDQGLRANNRAENSPEPNDGASVRALVRTGLTQHNLPADCSNDRADDCSTWTNSSKAAISIAK